MTAILTPHSNGRRDSRRSLADEIDRLDQLLDGLAEAIPATVADCIKDSVRDAVAEAVKTTLVEIASRPELLARLRSEPSTAASPVPPKAPPATPDRRIGSTIARAWRFTVNKVKCAARAITAPVRATGRALQEINELWNLRRPTLVAISVGTAIGIAGALSAPWLAGILSGLGAAGTTLGAQFATWTRRLYTSFA